MTQQPAHNSSNTTQLENWLTILVNSYAQNPSSGLAKVITYYIDRILYQYDICKQPNKRCQYLSMKKFWQWQSSNR